MKRIVWIILALLGTSTAVSSARADEPPSPDDETTAVQNPAVPPTPRPPQVAPPRSPGTTQPTPTPATAPNLTPVPPSPDVPDLTTPPAAAPLAAATPGLNAAAAARSNLAGLGPVYSPNMLGDQSPPSVRTSLLLPPSPPSMGRPPIPPGPGSSKFRGSVPAPSARGFKISDNQNPAQDRVFFTFNYFNDLNGAIDRGLNAPITSMQGYRYLFGYEKTFLDQDASIGFRLPLNNLNVQGSTSGLGGDSTALGNFTIFGKYVLWRDPATNSLISTGLAVTPPTGPSNFAGSPMTGGFRQTDIQPFVGYVWRRGKFFAQGFEAIDISTNSRDVTSIYSDIGIGYMIYQNQAPNAWLTGIAPTFETHVNTPLNHRGAFRPNDPAGTPDQVNFTFGTTFQFRQRSALSVAFVQPVVGPNAFNYEMTVLFNYYFGKTRRNVPLPPVIGG